jgi:hypothetical protein
MKIITAAESDASGDGENVSRNPQKINPALEHRFTSADRKRCISLEK